MPIGLIVSVSNSCQLDPSDHETLKQVVTPAQAGARLDQFLAQALGWSRARLQKLLKAGLVTVDGAPQAASHKVRAGEAVTRPGAPARAQPSHPRTPGPGDYL